MAVNLGNAVSGGIDVASAVASLLQVYDRPKVLLQTQQTLLQGQQSTLSSISTDLSTLLTKVDSLKDISGALNAKSTTSTNSNLATATAGATAQAGNHTVTVNTLAATGSSYSVELASATQTFTGGDFTFKLAGASSAITIKAGTYGNNITGLASAINNYSGGTGVTASVITDTKGARLALVSNASGAAGDITVSASPTGLGFTKATTGADASLTVDGVPIFSATNTVTQAIPGVTLNLTGADTNSTVTIGVNADTSQAASAIQAFVASYNKVVGDINAQNGSSTSSPVLAGDSTIRQLQQNILNDVTTSISGNGGLVNLDSIGVSVQNDGTLNVNSSTLNAALASNFNAVQNLFQNSTGVASIFHNDLNQLTSPTQGLIALAIKGTTASISSISDSIDAFNVQETAKETQLTAQYNQINVLLQQLPLLQQQTTAQLGSLK